MNKSGDDEYEKCVLEAGFPCQPWSQMGLGGGVTLPPPDCERLDVFISLIVSGGRLGPFRAKHNDTVGNLKDMLIGSGVGGPPRAQAKPESHPEPDHTERFRQAD